ncbi:hypothetical protein [Leucobacter sp.]
MSAAQVLVVLIAAAVGIASLAVYVARVCVGLVDSLDGSALLALVAFAVALFATISTRAER